MTEQPAHGSNPAQETESSLPPGPCGQFLQEMGISSKRLSDHCGVECIELSGGDLEAAMKKLRNSPETQLNYLLTVTGTDYPEHFESVYHLWSYDNNKELVVKVKVDRSLVRQGALPVVPSLANFWGTADWHERETYDLVGIRYAGHPYLRRILNPWDWEGYPLRRDYKQPVDALNDKNPHSMR
jgi:NADH-quinone oxidoreductase subunit C